MESLDHFLDSSLGNILGSILSWGLGGVDSNSFCGVQSSVLGSILGSVQESVLRNVLGNVSSDISGSIGSNVGFSFNFLGSSWGLGGISDSGFVGNSSLVGFSSLTSSWGLLALSTSGSTGSWLLTTSSTSGRVLTWKALNSGLDVLTINTVLIVFSWWWWWRSWLNKGVAAGVDLSLDFKIDLDWISLAIGEGLLGFLSKFSGVLGLVLSITFWWGHIWDISWMWLLESKVFFVTGWSILLISSKVGLVVLIKVPGMVSDNVRNNLRVGLNSVVIHLTGLSDALWVLSLVGLGKTWKNLVS